MTGSGPAGELTMADIRRRLERIMGVIEATADGQADTADQVAAALADESPRGGD